MGCSAHDVFKILDTLSDVVKDKISDTDNAEIKIFPGLKVTSKCVPSEQYNSNLKNVNIPSNHIVVTELIAGKRQGNIVSSLMTNFDVARKSLQTALNDADGSGERELESWNKGIEASLSHLKAQFQDFSTSAISSDMFKGIVDTGTKALGVMTKLAKSDSKLVNLPNVMALGLGIFQGKTNSGKSTWNSPHAFFKMTYAA